MTLPAPIIAELHAIAAEMRNLPRPCIHDERELIHWQNRLAKRVEGVAEIEVPAPSRPAANKRQHPRRPVSRTVVSGSGKRVQVEVRR